MRSMILAAIAALAFTAATCRNHVTGKIRMCAPRVVRHPVGPSLADLASPVGRAGETRRSMVGYM